MPRKILSALYHFCWYSLATVIILAAVAITLLRLALPDIGQYREDVQTWVSDYMGYPVQIRELNADWEGWIPNLYLEDIRIINPDSDTPMIGFRRASITLDLISSIRQQQLLPYRIKISGMDLSLVRYADGSISLLRAGSDSDEIEAQSGANELGQWFRRQKRIDLDDVSLSWLDLGHGRPAVHFSNAAISIHSDADRMQVGGSASTDQGLAPMRLEFALDIQGHLHTTDWSGQVYIAASQIDPGFWGEYFDFDRMNLGSDPGDLRLWSEWRATKLVQLDARLDFDRLSLHDYPLENIHADVRLARNRNDDWLVNLGLQEFTTKAGNWPAVSAEINLPDRDISNDRRLRAEISYLRLEDIFNIFGTTEFAPLTRLRQYLAGGEIKNLNMIVDPDHPLEYFWLDAETQLNVSNDQGLELTGISGHISADYDHGRFTLDSAVMGISLAGYYTVPLQLYNTRGSIDWQRTGDGLSFRTGVFQGETADFDFSLDTRLDIDADGNKHIDLLANVGPASVESIRDYLPFQDQSDIEQWLNKSVLGGTMLGADIVWRGPLSAFPYKGKEGRFQIITQVENTSLDYDPEWPPIDNLNAEIVVDNSALVITAASGNVFSSVLSDTVARIPDMFADKPHVLMQGHFEGTIRDSALFITQSPLHDINALKIVRDEEISGPLELDLDLDIPLHDEHTRIKGRLDLPGNKLESSDIGVSLTDLRGVIDFTRDTISSNKLRARYFDREIDLSVTKSADSEADAVIVNFTGAMDRGFLRKQFNHYFPNSRVMVNDYIDHFSGASTWQATLTIDDGKDSGSAGSRLDIRSDLIGMQVDLPAPLAKQKTESLPVELSTRLDAGERQILDFQIGNVMAARLEYSETGENVIDALRVNFGGKIQDLTSARGIRINGLLNEISLSEWVNLIQENMRKRTGTRRTDYNDVGVDVIISKLEFFNQTFTDVQLDVMKAEADWQIRVKSSALAGLISIPAGQNVVVLDLSHLHLTEHETEGQPDMDFDPATMPSIHAHVQSVVYGDKALGEMYLETSRIKQGLSFDELTFSKPEITIQGYGQWVRENNRPLSRFNFDIDADRLNAMLGTFQFTDASIKDGHTQISLEAEWFGRPVDFSLDNINGRLDMLIENGQFLDINPKAGRLFGLLSLQTLPRRLALDFTDIFSEGLSFDRIEGVFTIENGNAYTNDLQLIGPAANIAVTGRTGLIHKDYDQVVTVTPQISDTLPVASALFGPIGVGVGAVIYFAGELFQSIPDQIDKILQYQYTITGSWDNPVVEEIKDKNQASG